MLAEADRNAAEALTAVEPAWTAVRTAADALGLETRTLLHCGPPAVPAHALVQPHIELRRRRLRLRRLGGRPR